MGANRRGNRSAKRGDGMTLARAFPDRMREAMEPMLEAYLAEFEFDLRNRTLSETGPKGEPMPNPAHRTAMDMYPRIMRVVGASEELIAAILARLNMPDEASLLAASDMYLSAQEMTADHADQQWLTYGRRRIKSDPRFRAWAREVLFGEREVPIERDALTNGHTNGDAP